MRWIKKGLIFSSNEEFPWMKKYASVPIADWIGDDNYRVYFSSRDSENRSSVSYLEIDLKNPKKILRLSDSPILTPGKLGTFDDTGSMATSIINYNDKKYLYYIGWNQSKTVPFRWSIGLAISSDGGTSFTRYSDGPILDRNIMDPYLVSSPTVLLEKDLWKMYYISAIKWEHQNGVFNAPYHIRYAESNDGINWKRNGIVCIDFENKNETRFGRPSIIKDGDLYKMWYSYAGKSYRLGYAESLDGVKWVRKDDQVGIDVSSHGWDSEMIEYSYVFDHLGTRYMFYNGNEYGKTGFGYAILDDSDT